MRPTLKRVRDLLSYNPVTGEFAWKTYKRPMGTALSTHGYRRLRIDGALIYAHRLAWFYVYGVWPENKIDHANGLRADNRIMNLREADNSENAHNAKMQKNNACGFKGVWFCTQSNKWKSKIMKDYKSYHLGTFKKPEDAYSAYIKAASKLHGAFANTGDCHAPHS